MKKILMLINFILIFSFVLSEEQVRIKEIARIKGVRDNQLMGIGLVVGLNGTGDSAKIAPKMLENLYRYFGTEFANIQVQSKNIAVVMVTATLPPFKKIGDKIDVKISSLNNANNLEGGMLIQTPLYAGDKEVYAVAQGSLTKSDVKDSANKVTAYIPDGALVEKEVDYNFVFKDKIVIILNNPDFTTASRVADALNKRFNYDTATAIDASTIEVRKTFVYSDNIVGFISTIENISITPDRKSIIVINEKTGTIVLGENIKVAPVAISQGELSILIEAQTDIEKAFTSKNFSNPDAVKGNSVFFEGATIKDIVRMLNAIGASPNEIISILQALKASGSIEAEIKIM